MVTKIGKNNIFYFFENTAEIGQHFGGLNALRCTADIKKSFNTDFVKSSDKAIIVGPKNYEHRDLLIVYEDKKDIIELKVIYCSSTETNSFPEWFREIKKIFKNKMVVFTENTFKFYRGSADFFGNKNDIIFQEGIFHYLTRKSSIIFDNTWLLN